MAIITAKRSLWPPNKALGLLFLMEKRKRGLRKACEQVWIEIRVISSPWDGDPECSDKEKLMFFHRTAD